MTKNSDTIKLIKLISELKNMVEYNFLINRVLIGGLIIYTYYDPITFILRRTANIIYHSSRIATKFIITKSLQLCNKIKNGGMRITQFIGRNYRLSKNNVSALLYIKFFDRYILF